MLEQVKQAEGAEVVGRGVGQPRMRDAVVPTAGRRLRQGQAKVLARRERVSRLLWMQYLRARPALAGPVSGYAC